MIILHNKKKLGQFSRFENFANFTSSESGWITKNLFLVWTIYFVAELSYYRLRLPINLQNQRALLVLDGHNSRENPAALLILDAFLVDVLTLPGHHSHILQPFDLSIGSPLKINLAKELASGLFPVVSEEILPFPLLTRRMTRTNLQNLFMKSLRSALHHACTAQNIVSGFETAGFTPVNSGIPLGSKYICKSSPPN
jgi:hypothetical protein